MKKITDNITLVPIARDSYYMVSDIDVASTLLCKGYVFIDIAPLKGQKVEFIFKNHPAIEDVVRGFWSNRIEVYPLEFANARKNLKSCIFAMQRT